MYPILRSIILSVLLTTVFALTTAEAGDLSVLPLDGGTSIRFGKVDPAFTFDREVKIRVSGYEGQQYEVYQRIEQPLVNERGEYLERNALLSQGVLGSNANGSLYLNSYEPVRSGDQLIYTSNMSGSADTFRMLYSLNLNEIRNAGRFNGRIIYYVRSYGSSLQEEAVINISLEVEDEFQFEVGAQFGSEDVMLDTARMEESDNIRIAFSGFRGNRLSISQEVVDPLVKASGQRLDQSAIQFYVMNESEGDAYFTSVTDLKYAPQTIYEAESLSDVINIYYSINPDAVNGLDSGLYRGRVRVSIETDWNVEVEDFDIVLNVAPVFEMEIVYPPGGMMFDRVLPSMDPQERAVTVKVKTNLGRPYSVTQNMSTTLQNERGEPIDKNYFLIREDVLSEGEGNAKHPSFVPVSVNDMELFVSDRDGSPAEFQVIYQLKPYASIKDGNYQAAIRYSLGER